MNKHRLTSTVSAIVIAAALLPACASAPLRKAAVLNLELAKGVARVQATVESSYRAGEIPAGTYVDFNKAFLKAANAGMALNQAIRESNEQHAFAQVNAFVRMVDALIDTEVVKLPEPARTRVGLSLEGLRSVLIGLTAALGGA